MDPNRVPWRPIAIAHPTTSIPVFDAYIDALKSASGTDSPGGARQALDKTSLLDLARHAMHLQQSISSLTSARPLTSDKDDQALAVANEASTVFRDIIAQLLGFDPLSTTPSARSAAKAQEVFEVPELAEMILLHLSVRDLLSAAQVNRTMSSVVSTAPNIQARLGLRPSAMSSFSTVFPIARSSGPRRTHNHSGVICTIHTDAVRSTSNAVPVEVCVDIFTPRAVDYDSVLVLPNVGIRGRAMLVCQPPIKHLSVTANCCGQRHGHSSILAPKPLSPPPFSIRSERGITVGDALDAMARARIDHRHCPYAAITDHNYESGDVKVLVSLKGKLLLWTNDEALPQLWEEDATSPESRAQDVRRIEPSQLMLRYMAAKRSAAASGHVIGSFAKFVEEEGAKFVGSEVAG